ncbi:MAG: hypothetical protein RLZZ04_96 [Cyanobacteriota bacterium]|jgi:hypothetical protein
MSSREQLCLFDPVIDSDPVSITDNVSEPQSAKRKAIERYLERVNNEPLACVTKYSPGGRKSEYYRLSYRIGRKVKHVHLRGGNVRSELATYRANALQEIIDRGAELSEVLAAVATFNGSCGNVAHGDRLSKS